MYVWNKFGLALSRLRFCVSKTRNRYFAGPFPSLRFVHSVHGFQPVYTVINVCSQVLLSLSPSACLCHVFVFVGRGFGCRERTWKTWRLFCIEFIVIASPKKLSMVVLSQERLQLLPSVCAAWFYCPGQAFGDSWRASPSGCRCPWTWNVCHRRCCPELRSAVKFCAGWHTLDDVGIDYSRLRIVSFTARFIQVMNHMVTSIAKIMQVVQRCAKIFWRRRFTFTFAVFAIQFGFHLYHLSVDSRPGCANFCNIAKFKLN